MIDSRFILPQIAQELGVSSALVFGRLLSWFWKRDVVFRTNEEIASDLDGMLSISTIHRAKHKLIKAGFLTISFDKGHKRTTHFRLTEKALEIIKCLDFSNHKPAEAENTSKGIFNLIKDKFTDTSKTPQEAVSKEVKPKSYPTKAKTYNVPKTRNNADLETTKAQGEASTKSMQEAFAEEGRKRPEKSTMPDALRSLIQKKSAPTEETVSTDSKASLGSLLGSVFKSGVTQAQENLYRMKNDGLNYVEDY